MERNTKIGIGIAAGAIFVIAGLAGAFDDEPAADDKPAAAASPSPEPEAEKPNKKQKQAPETGPVFPGASVDAWAKTLGQDHRITYAKTGGPEPKLEGVEDRLKWFGEAKGANLSDPSYVASAVTNTDKQILTLTCAAASIPDSDSSQQAAYLADCVNAAGTDDTDPAKVTAWVAKQLPGMLGEDGAQFANTDIGPLSLRLNSAGDTAQMEVEPKG